MEQEIIDNCTAQSIYDYEYGNYECGYTGSDAEALEVVRDYFPCAKVKRKKYDEYITE